MKKIAFFVEGFTEQLFLSRFIREVYGRDRISITSTKGKGGNKVALSFTVISADSVTDSTKYVILISNCCGEKNVRSYIELQRASLIKAGYLKIIGIRDVYPTFKRSEINKLRKGLYYGLPQAQLRTDFILCVMEIESWFLSESNHFSKIDGNLNAARVHAMLSFDPANHDMELRDSPATDLHNCYQIVGKEYTKDEATIQRTIDALDFGELYLFPKPDSLKSLIGELDTFFT